MSRLAHVKSPYAAVLAQSRFDPHAVAVVTRSGDISYAKFARHIERVTRHLHAAQVRAGERVAVHVEAPYLQRLVVIALMRTGAVGVTLERAADLPVVKPDAIVSDQQTAWANARAIAVTPDWASRAADALPAFEDPPHDEGAPCHVVLSSGTTGLPRMALLSHGDMRDRIRGIGRLYGLNASARMLMGMGANTIAGLTVPIAAWANGGALVLPGPTKTPAHALRMNPNVLYLSPSHLCDLIDSLPAAHLPVQDMRVFVAGAELSRQVSRKARLQLTANLFMIYGSTETGSVACAHASVADGRPGFRGHVLPTAQVEIVDAKGNVQVPGVTGEIRIRTEGMVDRYLDDADANSGPLRGGWFYPGDIGALDDAGGLSILGRSVEPRDVGGAKFSPHVQR